MLMPLLFAIAMSAEPNEAEKLFREMEKKVHSAKTVECEFEIKAHGTRLKMTVKGSLILGEGDKLHIEANGTANGKSLKFVEISDGVKVLLAHNDKAEPKETTPKHLGRSMLAVISRSGPVTPLLSFQGSPKEEFKIDDLYPVSGFKLGKKEMIGEQEAQQIDFTITLDQEKIPVSVWIDTKTNLPLKRIVTVTVGMEKVACTETCSKFLLDLKVDPKKFELPKD